MLSVLWHLVLPEWRSAFRNVTAQITVLSQILCRASSLAGFAPTTQRELIQVYCVDMNPRTFFFLERVWLYNPCVAPLPSVLPLVLHCGSEISRRRYQVAENASRQIDLRWRRVTESPSPQKLTFQEEYSSGLFTVTMAVTMTIGHSVTYEHKY